MVCCVLSLAGIGASVHIGMKQACDRHEFRATNLPSRKADM